VLTELGRWVGRVVARVWRRVHSGGRAATRPTSLVAGLVEDAFRSREELIAENALLRQQLIVAVRGVVQPKFKAHERGLIVLLASLVRHWQSAVLLVQPQTVLRWHRHGFRLFWRWKSRNRSTALPRVAPETVELIRTMARDNRLWGAERIRGELLKLGIRVAKRTVQKYMRSTRRRSPSGQSWATFLRDHMHQIWACDFLQTYDIWFRPLFAFFIVELGSRKIVTVAVTSNPSSAWVAQQLRNATAFGVGPRFIVRDREDKYGGGFDRVARGADTRVLRTPVRAPKANAYCERFLGSVRRECVDHVMPFGERHLLETLLEYARHFNATRTHQGIGQLIPAGFSTAAVGSGSVIARPVLNGLHHDYRRAA
jgi:putative transposase